MVWLNSNVAQIPDTIIVTTKSGAKFECEMVLLAVGVRPEISLAKQAGLEIGALGGIRVTNQMQTSDEQYLGGG